MGLFDFLKKKPGEAGPAATPSLPARAREPVAPVAAPAAPPPEAAAGAPDATAAAPVTPTAAQGQPAAGPAPSTPAPSQAEPPPFVEATDAFGRRVRLPREQYRKEVLPELLKAHGNDPERLTAVLIEGLRQGFAKDLVAAANRLAVIDKEPERSLPLLAIVQRDAGDLDAAEFTLNELQQKRPGSPSAKVGLAMLAEQRGDMAQAETLLWQAVQRDPNHADAVHGYLQLRHRAVGDAGYRAELDQLCALPNSWRPQLWLARWHLQQSDPGTAGTLLRDALARAPDQSDALVMVANDLAAANQRELFGELVAPRFVPGRHHPHIGVLLLQFLAANQQHERGEQLLHQMYLHYGHMVGDALQPFTAEFDRMRLAKLSPPANPGAPPRIGLYRFDRPSWFAGLDEPHWLMPQKGPEARQVLFLGLSVDGQPKVEPGREDELGRLCRSVPLFLAEHVWLSTPHRGTAALPLAEGGGWALLGRPWPEEQLASQLGDRERVQTILVTGTLRIDGEQRRIDLWAYDCAQKARVGHAAAEGKVADLGSMVLQLMRELWPVLGGPADHKPPVGDPAFWARYLEGLGQHAALAVTMAGGMPKERLYGLRYIAQWLQSLPLQEPRWQPGFWLYASGLCVLAQLGSPVPKEHARTVAEFFRQSPANSAFALLAAKPLRAVGLEGFWGQRRAEVVAAAGGNALYLEWLGRAEKPV